MFDHILVLSTLLTYYLILVLQTNVAAAKPSLNKTWSDTLSSFLGRYCRLSVWLYFQLFVCYSVALYLQPAYIFQYLRVVICHSFFLPILFCSCMLNVYLCYCKCTQVTRCRFTTVIAYSFCKCTQVARCRFTTVIIHQPTRTHFVWTFVSALRLHVVGLPLWLHILSVSVLHCSWFISVIVHQPTRTHFVCTFVTCFSLSSSLSFFVSPPSSQSSHTRPSVHSNTIIVLTSYGEDDIAGGMFCLLLLSKWQIYPLFLSNTLSPIHT